MPAHSCRCGRGTASIRLSGGRGAPSHNSALTVPSGHADFPCCCHFRLRRTPQRQHRLLTPPAAVARLALSTEYSTRLGPLLLGDRASCSARALRPSLFATLPNAVATPLPRLDSGLHHITSHQELRLGGISVARCNNTRQTHTEGRSDTLASVAKRRSAVSVRGEQYTRNPQNRRLQHRGETDKAKAVLLSCSTPAVHFAL